MLPVVNVPATSSQRTSALRRSGWLLALLLALIAGLWLAPTTARAGTITVIDGPNTPPTADGVYTDGYIEAQLATSSLTITTTGVVTGPDEIRVLQGVTITWSTGNQLTLDAGSSIVISGTIQHDGPANGAGGLRLLASAAPTGTVIVGPGTQTASVAVGSRFGLTRVQAGNLVLHASQSFSGASHFAQLGFHAVDRGAAYTVTGAISVTVSHDITATGGITNFAYAQIGHGGADSTSSATLSGNFSGAIAVEAGGNVNFRGGIGSPAYTQLGNGGYNADGNHGGAHSLAAGGDVTFQGGGVVPSYAQFGNGGFLADGNHSGSHRLSAGGDVTFVGGVHYSTYVQFGNGGDFVNGNQSGSHRLVAGGDVTFVGGHNSGAYAQLGNGGEAAIGNHSGGHTAHAGGDVTFRAGDSNDTYAQFGNGGSGADGNQSGDHHLVASGNVTIGGDGSYSYAQFGNGGSGADGNHRGGLAMDNTGNLSMTAGLGQDAYAMIGHGADARIVTTSQSSGIRAGDIEVRVGETAAFSGSHVGHVTISGTLSITQGSTLIGVSQNDPSFATGPGQLLVTGVQTTSFSSAPDANGGELRFYLPREESQTIPITATFNGASFATANDIPAAQLQGFFLFGGGPYSAPYSFYLGGRADVNISKTAAPAGPLLPGQTLTYTVRFSNTGTLTATGVTVDDALPAALTFGSATPQPDAGVFITQTAAAPNLAWSVSALAPGQGGRIRIVAAVQNSALLLGATITNTATITAADDGSVSNNRSSVARNVAAAATLAITKTVVGNSPANAWQFAGSGGIGGFNLPAAGGSQSFDGLIPGAYVVTETTKPGYTAAVSCTNGQSGSNSVSVTLTPGQQMGCTFTNTYAPLETGSVEGLVYVDENNNEQPDTGEGLQGVTVTLASATGVAAALTLMDSTDGNGEYGFANVPTGNYTLRFAPPVGYRAIEDVDVTVTAGQTTTVPDQVTARVLPHKVYIPLLRDLNTEPPSIE